MFAATNSDWWLLVDCEEGNGHGRVGAWSGGEGVSWTEWPSIGALLSDAAAALETGRPIGGWAPVAFGGELDWKLLTAPAAPAPRSVLAMAATATEPVAPLRRQHGPHQTRSGWIDDYGNNSCLTFVENIDPEELLRRFGVGGPDVPVRRETALLTAAEARAAEHSWTAPPDRLQPAQVIQARQLAAETGLTEYPEITDALGRLAAGQTWQVTGESPLGLRFRLLAAEYAAANRAAPWENRSSVLTPSDQDAWKHRFSAAEAIMELIAGPPQRAARFVLAERKDPGWPDRFAADLGPVNTPPGAARAIADREGQEYNRAHGDGGAGYRVPVWPSRSSSWTA